MQMHWDDFFFAAVNMNHLNNLNKSHIFTFWQCCLSGHTISLPATHSEVMIPASLSCQLICMQKNTVGKKIKKRVDYIWSTNFWRKYWFIQTLEIGKEKSATMFLKVVETCLNWSEENCLFCVWTELSTQFCWESRWWCSFSLMQAGLKCCRRTGANSVSSLGRSERQGSWLRWMLRLRK